MDLKKYITEIEDYPKQGVSFKDITSLMSNGQAYRYVTDQIQKYAIEVGADVIVGPEARGFIVGCPVATSLEIGFVPVRKPGKLPRNTIDQSYTTEYSEETLTIHQGDLLTGQKVLITDDLLATGGTMEATINLVERSGAVVIGLAFIIELLNLKGRLRITDKYPIKSLIEY